MGPPPYDHDDPASPRKLGGYRILDCLGQGSFATVYRAQRQGLPGSVALKVLPQHVQGEALARFKREARLASRLEHPGIVRCFDVGEDSGSHYLGLEYVEGSSLEDRLRAGGALPWRQALEIMIPVADAIAYAHGQEVIHRDLKPANILLDASGAPRVTDFGLARDNTSVALTTAGEVLGTPFYMAPEQIQGDQATPLFDVHALGAILYELLTSSPPYPGASVAEVSGLIIRGNPIPPSRSSPYPLPQALDQIVLETLATDPARRTQSAAGLALALRQVLLSGGDPQPAASLKPRSMIGFALGAGGGLALGLVALFAFSPLTAPLPPPVDPLDDATPDPLDESTPDPLENPIANATLDPVKQPPPTTSDGSNTAAWKQALEETRAKVRAWDWKAAEAGIARARGLARGELEHGEVRRLGKLLEDERGLERATVSDVSERHTKQFDAWTALSEAERELVAHPASAQLTRLAFKLNAICGNYARAQELGKGLSERSQEDEMRLQLSAANMSGPPPALKGTALWERWAPLAGGSWSLRESGEVHGSGYGQGEFEFAGLVLKDPRRIAPPYQVQVEVKLDYSRPLSYAGLAFGARDSENMLLVYVFHHDDMLAQAPPKELAMIREKSIGLPKFYRIAAFVGGRWAHYDTQLCVFPDDVFVPLVVTVNQRSLQVEIDGKRMRDFELREPVQPGRVGVIKWYDTKATFRGLRATPR